MPLIIPGKPQIDFCLRTTKPFHKESVFEDIPSEQREKVVEYFKESVAPEIRAELGRGFLFCPYHASEKYDRKKKLVPEFPIRELFGKYLPEEFGHGL